METLHKHKGYLHQQEEWKQGHQADKPCSLRSVSGEGSAGRRSQNACCEPFNLDAKDPTVVQLFPMLLKIKSSCSHPTMPLPGQKERKLLWQFHYSCMQKSSTKFWTDHCIQSDSCNLILAW